MTSPGFTQKVV